MMRARDASCALMMQLAYSQAASTKAIMGSMSSKYPLIHFNSFHFLRIPFDSLASVQFRTVSFPIRSVRRISCTSSHRIHEINPPAPLDLPAPRVSQVEPRAPHLEIDRVFFSGSLVHPIFYQADK